MQNESARVREIELGAKPTTFVALDADTLLVGFAAGPLQVYDLKSGDKLRDVDLSPPAECSALVSLPLGRVAVGRKTAKDAFEVVALAVATGSVLGREAGTGTLCGLGFVDGNLIAASADKSVSVWAVDVEGAVRVDSECIEMFVRGKYCFSFIDVAPAPHPSRLHVSAYLRSSRSRPSS